ncbi:MAG TPA: hypothetical protein VGM49_08385 [Candidatus Limnocylindrales bacterium]|jgi:Ca-activated chloride channel family protein
MDRRSSRGLLGSSLAGLLLVAGCGGGGGAATPTPAAPAATVAPTSGAASAASTDSAASSEPVATAAPATATVTGPANLSGPAEIGAGAPFQVTWSGPNNAGDYVTIVAAGAVKWTNEPYFYTNVGSPGTLTAPSKDGAYALWYVSGVDDSILARVAIRVAPFSGNLSGPDSVQAGSQFDVSWTGPNGPKDYVTVVNVGTSSWTNESYFYTTAGPTGQLIASIEPGPYELWYVIGSDDSVMARRPIVVTPFMITLDAPKAVTHGAAFHVTWSGPNGPSDYITIVPAGSPPGTYTSYAYTSAGSPVTITAPPTPGNYEIWYASDRVRDVIFAKVSIKVT